MISTSRMLTFRYERSRENNCSALQQTVSGSPANRLRRGYVGQEAGRHVLQSAICNLKSAISVII
jgi:hypothetical protein